MLDFYYLRSHCFTCYGNLFFFTPLAGTQWEMNDLWQNINYVFLLWLVSQMLTVRNGLSLHPMWLPGVLEPMQLPQTGIVFDEGNELLHTNRGTNNISANEETTVQTAFNLSNQCNISNQPIAIPSVADTNTPETPFGLEPLIQSHYEPFNLQSSKVTLVWATNYSSLHLELTAAILLQYEGNLRGSCTTSAFRHEFHWEELFVGRVLGSELGVWQLWWPYEQQVLVKHHRTAIDLLNNWKILHSDRFIYVARHIRLNWWHPFNHI